MDLSPTHYDPTLDVIVASDASSYGISACILHKLPDGSRKAVAYSSRSLLPAEKQYSQIEKKDPGIIFAVTKFHWYLHGRRFTQQMDHKPLITIFGSKKGLPVDTANRLLRWGTILLNYNFKIEFLTTKNICYADSLSRLIPKNTEVFEDSIIATLRTNLRNQKQCSQEKSSPSSINSFHDKQSSREPSRPIRNISILAIKFFSRPTKTTWHSRSRHHQTKDGVSSRLVTRADVSDELRCGIVVREFVLQSRYYVHFRANTLGKGMNPLILPPDMGK